MSKGFKNPTLARRILLWVKLSGTIHPRERRHTDGGNCDSGEKLSDGFPSVQRVHTPNPPTINMAFGAVKGG